MQASEFDGITREFGEVLTRRNVLRLFAGAAAAGVAAGIGRDKPAAAKRKRGKKKGQPSNNKRPQPQVACTSWIISGGPNPVTPIEVDDDVSIKVNGISVFSDGDGKAGPVGPVRFAAQVGDQLDIDASDVGVACRAISALWLHCATTGRKRQLSDGVNDGCAPGRLAGGFYGGAFAVSV